VGGGGVKKKRKEKATYVPTFFWGDCFEIFRFYFCKYPRGVFEVLMQRNSQRPMSKGATEGAVVAFMAFFFLPYTLAPCSCSLVLLF
jgi:hypothetical protein